ncbi:MAG: M23 family metallopeptidase [Treponema sp.]|nr:M23 family metallopeptidase [Treponema sp.]
MEVISFANTAAVRKTGSAKSIPQIFNYSTGCKKNRECNARHEKKGLNFAYLLVLPFCVLISVCVIFALNNYDSHARIVNFDLSDISEEEFINQAMFECAKNTDTFFNSEGYVVQGIGEASVHEFVFKEPVSYQEYTVKAGDTISSISYKFGLSNISTLIAINNISNVRYLKFGQKLKIPSVDGLLHKVSSSDTLESLSVKYHVTVEDILDINDLDTEVLYEGQELFIPGAKLDTKSLQKAMGELFICPIKASWRLSSAFGPRPDPFSGASSYHTGIDLACPQGTSVKASMSGTVAYASWSNVFGNYVIIKHIDGYQTLYGHLLKIKTKQGQFVSQGQEIGLVGSTGYSTGPHLHFTVYKNGKLVNPMSVLK